MILALRLAAFALGGYLSMSCAKEIGSGGYYPLIGFAVGPIFGLVVLIWLGDSVRSLWSAKSLAFLLLSTLIWALVDWLLHLSVGDKYFDLMILVGSILLPCAHAWVFQSSWRRAGLAILLSFAAFEGWRLIAMGLMGLPSWSRDVISAALLWQGGYLLAMFGGAGTSSRYSFIE